MQTHHSMVSVAMSTYEMAGSGRAFLRGALKSIEVQDVNDIEVVIVDDSSDRQIEIECKEWARKLEIKYIRVTEARKSASQKFNLAIDNCTRPIVKILCQDDLLSCPTSLKQTIEGLSTGHTWLVTAYAHIDKDDVKVSSHMPKFHPHIERVNTIGSHSGLAFRRDVQQQRFDERLFWRMDCELYRRLYENYGQPFVLREETVHVRQWPGQSTNRLIGINDRFREWLYVVRRYPQRLDFHI